MFNTIRQLLQTDKKLRLLLLGGLIIQLITCITAVGTSSADQHFQIIEFSLYQLGKPNGATAVWEITHFVRPTLQVYLFSGYHVASLALGLTDPYVQLTILRIVLGLSMFLVFNLIGLYYFKNSSRKILYAVVALINFSWALPYTRTLYCSEMVSSVVFFGTLALYNYRKDRSPRFGFLVLIGFLFSLAFYLRFQIGFALAGFGVALLFFEKRYRHLLPLALGFVAGMLINVYLDFRFYKEWVFTPFAYFFVNIVDERAKGFGTSSFLRYIGLILLVAPAIPASIMFFYYDLKVAIRKYRDPLYLAILFFIVAHCLVGHKEERFLFPIFNVLPVVTGWGLEDLKKYYTRARAWAKAGIRALIVTTVVINSLLLLFATFVPYSQTIRFSEKLKNRFHDRQITLYCLGQTPFETPGGSPMMFYKNGVPNIKLQRVISEDSIALIGGDHLYLATTYNRIKNRKGLFDSLGYKPAMHSSDLLWNLNAFLQSKKLTTINEIWVLYERP